METTCENCLYFKKSIAGPWEGNCHLGPPPFHGVRTFEWCGHWQFKSIEMPGVYDSSDGLIGPRESA